MKCALYGTKMCEDSRVKCFMILETEYANVVLDMILAGIALWWSDTEYANVDPDMILGRVALWCFDKAYANLAPDMFLVRIA